MRSHDSCRVFLAASTLALGGCGDGVTGASRSSPGREAAMVIEGFPATQQIRTGDNLLLTLQPVPSDVESIRWLSDAPAVASLTATPALSPCGSACAWLRGESAGRARLEVVACFVDGACVSVTRAKVAAGAGSQQVETALSVTP